MSGGGGGGGSGGGGGTVASPKTYNLATALRRHESGLAQLGPGPTLRLAKRLFSAAVGWLTRTLAVEVWT